MTLYRATHAVALVVVLTPLVLMLLAVVAMLAANLVMPLWECDWERAAVFWGAFGFVACGLFLVLTERPWP